MKKSTEAKTSMGGPMNSRQLILLPRSGAGAARKSLSFCEFEMFDTTWVLERLLRNRSGVAGRCWFQPTRIHSLLLEVGRRCGCAAANSWHHSSGRSHPQKVALPTCGESCCAVNPSGPTTAWCHRACARRLRCFHLPPISSQSAASFQLHRSG
jgi:hypothetical protein